ncbi:MAG: hypothetical protein M1820_010018, partial [Bogoriella megaspora]
MYLPRSLISHLYTSLLTTHHALSSPVLLLVALDADALCAARILTALLKRDYIPHKIQPVQGYADLARAGAELVRPMRTSDGGMGGVVVCLGVGALVDLEEVLGLDDQAGMGGVEVWVVDSRRPWNLDNVFRDHVVAQEIAGDQDGGEMVQKVAGVERGRLGKGYRSGRGGIVVFDDGDIEEELEREREAYCALERMPEVDDEGSEVEETDVEDDEDHEGGRTRKRKSWDRADDESEEEDNDGRARRRRRSNSGSSIDATPERPQRRGLISVPNEGDTQGSSDVSRAASPRSHSTSPPPVPQQPSARTLRRRLLRLRRKHESVLHAYYALGTSYSEPVSSILYSLASELGREDNDLLWLSIVGVSSNELYGRTLSGITATPHTPSPTFSSWNSDRGERIRAILRDEVRRLNPTPLSDVARDRELATTGGVIPTHARSPTDTSIRLSPEPRFLLIRHWSLYDSMLHSPYLSARLHIWSDAGQRRLHKLLAKMGVSLAQCRQSYTHMDMELKRGLRQRLLRFAPMYGLEGLVPPADAGKEGWGFVRSWGWKACLSATDIAVVLGAILEVSHVGAAADAIGLPTPDSTQDSSGRAPGADAEHDAQRADTMNARFWLAYDALSPLASTSNPPTSGLPLLLAHIPTAQMLHKAILSTGSALLAKKQIRHLRAFRMGVVREGPDVALFTQPGALVKLALWVAEAVGVLDGEKSGKGFGSGKKRDALVLAGLDEGRG